MNIGLKTPPSFARFAIDVFIKKIPVLPAESPSAVEKALSSRLTMLFSEKIAFPPG